MLTVKLADPQFWAMVVYHLRPVPEPAELGTLAVDGTVLVTDSGPKGSVLPCGMVMGSGVAAYQTGRLLEKTGQEQPSGAWATEFS